VTLVDARAAFVQRIRLHETLAGGKPKELPYAPLLARGGVRFVQARVERLDLTNRVLFLRDASGNVSTLRYDALVLAVGSRVGAPLPGVAEHAIRLNEPSELGRRSAGLPALAASGGQALVVGGGLTGIEAASELAERYPGLRVTLATSGELGTAFSTAAAQHLRRRFAVLGIEVAEGAAIAGIDSKEAHLKGCGRLPFELCVWAGGFEAHPLARESGLTVMEDGRAVVDDTLRSVSHPEVLVAGDAALVRAGGLEVRMGCVSALPMGAHAGANVRRLLQGEEPAAFDFGFAFRCVSLGRRDGLIQFTDAADRPKEKVWVGHSGAFTKETVCRMTFMAPALELRTGLPLYRWPGSLHRAGTSCLTT
jgi:NADH dehydrogenase FAD-containing subunit